MCQIEDLFEDDIYEELKLDVMEEAMKFGDIEKIEIPRPDKDTGYCSPAVGKVFLKFRYNIPAKKARHNLSGKKYFLVSKNDFYI